MQCGDWKSFLSGMGGDGGKTKREARQEKGEGGVSGREKEGGGFWERMSSI